MRILIAHPEESARLRWQRALGDLLPGASVEGWRPGAAPADYAVGWLSEPGFFEEQTRLRAVFSAGAGVDHLLAQPALPPALPIVRLEDAGMGAQMIEYCLHEALRLQRRTGDYEAQQRERRWQVLRALRREELAIGVFGLGVLGRQVARALADFGYPVRGCARDPRRLEEREGREGREGIEGSESGAGREGLEGIELFSSDGEGLRRFLSGCRMLVVLAPLTDATRGLFDAERLAWLPEGAWLVNVARGALIDERALLAALDSGRLAGATLDVFAEEPLPPAHPFWDHPKVRITPHASAVTVVEISASQVAAKIAALERGEPVGGLVERARGY